jgi:micrococcal nuclease
MSSSTRVLSFLAAALLATGCAPCPTCPPCPACEDCASSKAEEPAADQRWFVQRVKDGDTLVARLEGGPTDRTETIRLLNINTPEKEQPGWTEAAEALKTLVRGGYVELEFQAVGVERRDGFGRLLAYVVSEGVNVNLELVRQGWSPYYTKYGKGRLRAKFEAAEAEARAARRGLWAPRD